MLDMCFEASCAVLCANSQTKALKYVQCQKLHVNTPPTTITGIFINALFVVILGMKVMW